MSLKLGNYELKDDFFVVSIGGTDDVVLGIQWLWYLREITLNLQTMKLKFMSQGRRVLLQGMSNRGPRIVSLNKMEQLIRHDQVGWAAECIIISSSPLEEKRSYPVDIQALITKRSRCLIIHLLVDLPSEVLNTSLS